MRTLLSLITVHCLLIHYALAPAASAEVAERIAAGRQLLNQGKLEAAISAFKAAVAMDPKDGAAFLNLGQAYERANRSEDAIDAYRKSIELEPDNFYARNNIGVLYDKQGKYEDAITEFQNALSREPSNTLALKNLETAKRNKTTVSERNAQISRAEKEAEGKPKDPNSAYQLARTYASYGSKEKAIEWLGKALQLGYHDIAYVRADPAFVGLRQEREFELLVLKK
jgi:superkiller protein 3